MNEISSPYVDEKLRFETELSLLLKKYHLESWFILYLEKKPSKWHWVGLFDEDEISSVIEEALEEIKE